MKIRWFIYSSLLFVALALPFVYQNMSNNIQKQEQLNRQNQKSWLNLMTNIEFDLARKAIGKDSFWHHYLKGLDYFQLELKMIKEDLDNIKI